MLFADKQLVSLNLIEEVAPAIVLLAEVVLYAVRPDLVRPMAAIERLELFRNLDVDRIPFSKVEWAYGTDSISSNLDWIWPARPFTIATKFSDLDSRMWMRSGMERSS